MTDLYTTQPKQIVMYSNEYCPDCQRARAFFETNAIPYLLVNLEENQMAVDFIMQVNHGFRCVPTIILPDGSILVEPTWEQLSENFFPT